MLQLIKKFKTGLRTFNVYIKKMFGKMEIKYIQMKCRIERFFDENEFLPFGEGLKVFLIKFGKALLWGILIPIWLFLCWECSNFALVISIGSLVFLRLKDDELQQKRKENETKAIDEEESNLCEKYVSWIIGFAFISCFEAIIAFVTYVALKVIEYYKDNRDLWKTNKKKFICGLVLILIKALLFLFVIKHAIAAFAIYLSMSLIVWILWPFCFKNQGFLKSDSLLCHILTIFQNDFKFSPFFEEENKTPNECNNIRKKPAY